MLRRATSPLLRYRHHSVRKSLHTSRTVKMPVVHMVWFKTPTLTPENWEELRTACKNLETIPGVISAEIGENFTDRARGFNVGLYVRLENKPALEVYAPHPVHETFKTIIAKWREDVLAMDFESS